MRNLAIYIPGKGGNAQESEHYKPLFRDRDVIGFDYQSKNPWEAQKEFSDFYDSYSKEYDSIIIIANSIGAFFSLSSLADKQIDEALLISPIVDMEKLICDMMIWANVSEKELSERKEIVTNFGETLYWEYLCYVRKQSIEWNIPTFILYGEKDNLTSFDTISSFAKKVGASLTVMPDGEHWFHTDEQMAFLDNWVSKSIR
ncbi:MAG: alpha/beta hydrolase [Clostridia bacterium]|nr:alpha/beta hydrolase [Clostridia bacterium]NLS86079.1 alpha/beta hydrolase [Oscillospiraceae bacterium]